MRRKRAFISFDFDHDGELRDALVGQANLPQSPYQHSRTVCSLST